MTDVVTSFSLIQFYSVVFVDRVRFSLVLVKVQELISRQKVSNGVYYFVFDVDVSLQYAKTC